MTVLQRMAMVVVVVYAMKNVVLVIYWITITKRIAGRNITLCAFYTDRSIVGPDLN